MPTTIKLKNSVTTTSAPSSLVQGEVAINITDKKVWVGNAATTPIQLLGDGGSASFTSIAFGAGTVSSPSITFTGDTNTGIYSPAADTIAFTEGGVESMRIDSSGNVGIGTSSPQLRLTVKSSTDQNFNIGGASALADGIRITSTNDAGTINLGMQFGGSVFVWTSTGTERMRIDSSGNVGIGTSSPARRIDARSTSSDYQYRAGDSANPVLSYDFGRENTAGLFKFYGNQTGATGYIFDGVDGERMRITTTGNVGIGTSSPARTLDVNGNMRLGTANGRFIEILNASSEATYISQESSAELRINQSTSGANSKIAFLTQGSERMRIDSSGNVGIGTSSPTNSFNYTTLSLNGTTGGQLVFQTGSVYKHSIYSSSTDLNLLNSVAGNMTFGTNNTERMRIDSSGNLLVGTTSSSYGRISSTAKSGFNPGINQTWNTAPAISVSGVFGGGISLIDGAAGYGFYCSDNGNDFYIQGSSSLSTALTGGVYLDNRATSWSSASDEKVKDIIEPITNGLQKLLTLRTVIGKYKDEPEGKRHPFLIAQDVQAVLPEAVSTMHKGQENECLGLSYTDTIPLLVAAIKEQQAMIEELKQEVAKLKGV